MKSLTDLDPRDRRYPSKPGLFCAAPIARGSYCAEHAAICLTGPARDLTPSADYLAGGRYIQRRSTREDTDLVTVYQSKTATRSAIAKAHHAIVPR